VLLMHMCITTRSSWEPVAQQLSAAGINAVTIDNRGFARKRRTAGFDPGKPDVATAVERKMAWRFRCGFSRGSSLNLASTRAASARAAGPAA